MRVAIISSGFLPVLDGVTISVQRRVERLSRWGHEVLLFCPDYATLSEIYPRWKDYCGDILPGVRVVNLPSTRFADQDFDRNVAPGSHAIVVKELERFRPEVIHVDEPERLFAGFLRVPGVRFARRTKTPCVSFYHTNFLEYGEHYLAGVPALLARGLEFMARRLRNFIYNAYDLTLVSSRITSEKLVKQGIRNTRQASLLGIDPERFGPRLRAEGFFEKTYGLAGVDPHVKVVFLGRLAADKGWGFTLEALSRTVAPEDLRKAALLIVGDGPMEGEIRARLAPLAASVHFLGRVPHDDVPAILANADLHVTASEKESLGLTVLEAMASGIPVLVPRQGGVLEEVRDGWNGVVFTPRDHADFSGKLARLLDDRAARKTMGQNGWQHVQQFGWDHTTGNLVAIWEECRALRRAA